ncbi:hypothetical protein QQG55_44245 [Brugia pahangi]|uniref:ANK_REP_REGION domain-containing protein n=1 Tax=Brugia pahangi TaxID=6280 RepID=A0A0N4TKL9_BRUPA|nr:unnamed protein product [Brugia pahangi]
MSVPKDNCTSISIHLENLWEVFRNDPFSEKSIDFARLTAAYYLGFPLLAPRNPGSLPSLYEWPKSSSEVNLNEAVLLKRVDIAKTVSTICDERTPPVLLWACGHHIEAIYYCDQFRDLKSQAMLRFLEEQLSGLKFLQIFCEGRIEMAFNELDSLKETTEYGSMRNMQFSWDKLVDSLLQMDAIAETNAVNFLLDRILVKMCSIYEMMPLFVNTNISLPRPPVYMCTTFIDFGKEQYCYIRLWILIQAYARLLSDANVLLICIEYFCWNFLEINGKCENQMKNATIKYYNLLDEAGDNDVNVLLVKWMKEADQSDFAQLNHFFDYLSTFRSPFVHMREFCPENITCWRNHLLKGVKLQKDVRRTKIQQDQQMNVIRTKVSHGILIRAEYIARCWSYPTYVADEGLLAMNLKLCPSEFVHVATPGISASTPRIEFASRMCHPSLFDTRPCVQRPIAITSRSFPTVTRYLRTRNISDTERMDSWRKLDSAMQKVNVMIDEVEQELKSASSYVKTLLNNRPKTFIENATNNNGDNKMSSSDFSSPASQNLETSFIEQCKLVNDDRYSLDSNHEPECHLEIGKLNFDLLSPPPTVRNTTAVNISAPAPNASLPFPVASDSLCAITTPSPLPVWLKLLPVKQKNFLLSLTPVIKQVKESRKDDNVSKIQLPQMKLLEVLDEERQLPRSNLKFELVTTIASTQLCD